MTKVRQKISLRLHKAGQDLIDGAGKSNRLFPREMRCTPPPTQKRDRTPPSFPCDPCPTLCPVHPYHCTWPPASGPKSSRRRARVLTAVSWYGN